MKRRSRPHGVLYVGHLPKEMNELYLRRYFEQFGTITNVKIPRSKRTGNFKGYGFIEFAEPKVAKIAASTMDKYFIDGRMLHVEYRETNKKNFFKDNNNFTRADRRQKYAKECMRV